jgi:outer membrane lipoprotein-sorting protein
MNHRILTPRLPALLSVLLFTGLLLAGSWPGAATTDPAPDWPDGNEVLGAVDANAGSRNKRLEASMVIHGRRGTRTVRSRSWIEGTHQSFTEFLEPARERGTKMLKEGDQLWTYSPSTDRIIKISGHLLRQAVMGSDLSYEDLLEDPKLSQLYQAATTGEDSVLGRPCWVLDLTSRGRDIAYDRRRVWVDRERSVLLREERFAKSGTLLKTTEVREVKQVQGRWIANHVVFRDILKDGQGTEFLLEAIDFDVKIPAHIFSKASLRK